MSKAVKNMMMEQLGQQLGDCRELLVVNTSALDAVTDNKLRIELHKKGIQVLQVKNSLARRTLSARGVSLDHCLQGPSTLVWGGPDVVALSKEIAQWAKQISKIEIKGGTVDGQALDAKAVDTLSKSPGRIELLGQIAALMLSPGGRLAAAMTGPGGRLAGAVKTIADKDEGAAAPEGAAAS